MSLTVRFGWPSRYLRNRTDSQGAAVVQTLGLPSVKAYTSAIVDLWRFQQSLGRKLQAQEAYLRTTVDFLFGHNMLLRGEDWRHLELADLFTLRMDEGPTPCWPMILMKLNGKTNQFGQLKYMGVVQHKDPLLCTICHTAFYLFHGWEIMHEPVPQPLSGHSSTQRAVRISPFLPDVSYNTDLRELWEEWHVGIHGNPSIQSLEDSYRCRWRSDNKERVFFSCRKVIIDWIQAQVSKGILLADAIDEIELMRRTSQRTLYQLQALLKKVSYSPSPLLLQIASNGRQTSRFARRTLALPNSEQINPLQAHHQFLRSSLSYGHGKEVFDAEAEAALAGAQAAIAYPTAQFATNLWICLDNLEDLPKKSLNPSAPLQPPGHFAKGFLILKADLSKSDGSLDTPGSLRTKRLISLLKRELPQSLLLLTNPHTPR
ncbi:hypothetical protein TSTA_127010 [Talaromyces stipitatus ATCC 10500]|uniref:Uncharacterized protein n=1 Tax=Talaromyces stipitatus (strain ATCC 10500 / CBS 375.48 / QM 6759 / NRRL 1006) TaxID=441959 RepID=B8MCU1_TALSN|nr:uncharacterized protein TSTA_127010 [Talaromyces stipitatus ATCC 10500]EED18993.1 hypothetical protein TSTA_127010 [Talaromyces stipitatus ATCC 10500]